MLLYVHPTLVWLLQQLVNKAPSFHWKLRVFSFPYNGEQPPSPQLHAWGWGEGGNANYSTSSSSQLASWYSGLCFLVWGHWPRRWNCQRLHLQMPKAPNYIIHVHVYGYQFPEHIVEDHNVWDIWPIPLRIRTKPAESLAVEGAVSSWGQSSPSTNVV